MFKQDGEPSPAAINGTQSLELHPQPLEQARTVAFSATWQRRSSLPISCISIANPMLVPTPPPNESQPMIPDTRPLSLFGPHSPLEIHSQVLESRAHSVENNIVIPQTQPLGHPTEPSELLTQPSAQFASSAEIHAQPTTQSETSPSVPFASNCITMPYPQTIPSLHLLPLDDSTALKHIPLANNIRVKIGRHTNSKTVPSEHNGYFDNRVLSRRHSEIWEEGGKVRTPTLSSF